MKTYTFGKWSASIKATAMAYEADHFFLSDSISISIAKLVINVNAWILSSAFPPSEGVTASAHMLHLSPV